MFYGVYFLCVWVLWYNFIRWKSGTVSRWNLCMDRFKGDYFKIWLTFYSQASVRSPLYTDIQLIWSFICEVNVKISTIFVHILELGTNATETIMPGTWSVLDHCLQNDITMVEVGQQCEPNTTLAAVTKAVGLLTVEDKSASLWLCYSRYPLGDQLFWERGPSSECIHMDWSDSPRCSWAKFYFTRSVQKYL